MKVGTPPPHASCFQQLGILADFMWSPRVSKNAQYFTLKYAAEAGEEAQWLKMFTGQP